MNADSDSEPNLSAEYRFDAIKSDISSSSRLCRCSYRPTIID